MTSLASATKAAQYVRMSTDHQQYSTDNQKAAIATYAAAHGMEIVATYEDAGKSGLTLKGRPALRQLIADVVAGQDLFDTILVYDVSRWGRFQDADESAHLEYLCRLAGVRVEYCAEPFFNDGTPLSSIYKVIKRALAAEYSRELSVKVYVGKRRLGELGFRLGGSAGFGLRRCLVDASRVPKELLSRGQYKSIATDRIILVPGPPEEVAIVRRIYRDYTARGLGCRAIAAKLNREGVRSESGRAWSKSVVSQILKSEKYVGDSVWGRSSFKLKMKRRRNAPATWAQVPGAFEGIISRQLYQKAQKVRAARTKPVTREQILAGLRRIYRKHGVITRRLIRKDGFAGPTTIRKFFGDLMSAYASMGFQPSRRIADMSSKAAARRFRSATGRVLVEGITAQGGTVESLSGACRFRINGEISVSVTVAQQRDCLARSPRWEIKRGGSGDDITLAVLMDANQQRARAFYFLPNDVLGRGLCLASQNSPYIDAFRSDSLQAVFELFTRCDAGAESLLEANSGALMSNGSSERSSEPPSTARVRVRQCRSASLKSYTGAFLRTSARLRRIIAKSRAVRSRLESLRRALAELLLDEQLVRVLSQQGAATVPQAALECRAAMRDQVRLFQSQLRKQAVDLLSGNGLTRRTRNLLDKLTPERRIEAAEIMVLSNDATEGNARALILTTPEHGLVERPETHVDRARRRALKRMADESAYSYREAKGSLASFGHEALALVALAAYARRLLAMPVVVAWLERHDREALRALK